MTRKRRLIRGIQLRLPAWVMFVATAAATGWVGRATMEGRIVASVISVLMFAVVAFGARTRRRILDHRDDLREARSKREDIRATLDHLPGLAWRSDEKGNRSFISAAWEAFTGQPIADALGSGWLQQVADLDRNHCLVAHQLSAKRREPYELEYRVRLADGTYHVVHDRVAPCFDSRGRFSGYVGLSTDLAAVADARERSDTLQRLISLNEGINRQALELIERYDDLEDSRQHALYSEELKTEYLAALADELQSPIDEILNVLDLFESPDLTTTQRGHVERIRRECGSLGIARDRSQCLGRPEGIEEGAEPGQFDLRALVAHVMRRQEAAAEARGLVAGCILEDIVPSRVQGEPLRMRRLLMELWVTALRLARKGRVTMRVSPETADGNDTLVNFSISLAGDGVTEDQLERAYYPSIPSNGEPIGLGLGPCKRLVDLMGGRIGVNRDARGMVTIWATVRLVELNPNWAGRRTHGRLTQEAVKSSLGKVLDLSMGGMRIQCTKPPSGEVEFKLSDDEESIDLCAVVAWTKRVGFGKHQVGLKFTAVDAEKNLQLSRLATRNSMRRVFQVA